MFASPAVYTRRCALAAQLRKLHLGIGQIFSRDMTVQCDAQHPCWKAAHFLPCTRPPDVMRLHRSSKRATYGPSQRRAYALTRSGFQTMPESDQEDTSTAQAARGGSSSRGARPRRDDDRSRAWNRRDFIPADDPGWARCTVKRHEDFCQRWTLWGLDIRDLEILGTGSWTLGGRGFEQSSMG